MTYDMFCELMKELKRINENLEELINPQKEIERAPRIVDNTSDDWVGWHNGGDMILTKPDVEEQVKEEPVKETKRGRKKKGDVQ